MASQVIRLDIEPQGQARHRHTKAGRAYTPASSRAYGKALDALLMPHSVTNDGAIRVEIVAVFPRPAYASRRSKRTGLMLGGYDEGRYPHTSKPDGDNVAKAVLDSMTRCGWWGDDASVSDLRVVKIVAAMGERPSITITVSHHTNGDDALSTTPDDGEQGPRVD